MDKNFADDDGVSFYDEGKDGNHPYLKMYYMRQTTRGLMALKTLNVTKVDST